MNESNYKTETITADDGTEYVPCETSEADGLWSNGKFIEGEFENLYFSGLAFHMSMCYHRDWQALGAIPVKKVVPKKEPYKRETIISNTHGLSGGLRAYGAFSDMPTETNRTFRLTLEEITEQEPAPELDLSPLTEEEFQRLEIGDTYTYKGHDYVKTVKVRGKRQPFFYDAEGSFWGLGDCDSLHPTPETARRLGRGVKS
jgi:hypothetical protein